jgi:hypothetical protein
LALKARLPTISQNSSDSSRARALIPQLGFGDGKVLPATSAFGAVGADQVFEGVVVLREATGTSGIAESEFEKLKA